MKKRWKKIMFGLLLLITVLISGTILFSPYGNKNGFNYKLIINTIEIDAPVDSVYKFLGHSSNAHKWSVFVDHIAPLNSESVKDGQPGSVRRCYKSADEQGLQWDEMITENEPLKKRQLTIFNMKDFFTKADNLATEQLYETISAKKTKLSFTLFFKDHEPSLVESLKIYFAAYKVKSIYEKNMLNIKRIVETGK